MGLKDIIVKDASLKSDKNIRMKFLSLATSFDEDLEANLELTSIELNEKYFTEDVSGWRKFLKHTPVRKYINDFLDEIAEKNARKTLTSGEVQHARDALKVKENIEANYKGDDNSNIVVWFLPQKDYLNEN